MTPITFLLAPALLAVTVMLPLPAAAQTSAPVAEAPVAEAPVAEAPIAEAPVAEALADEASAAEAPVAEAPVAEAPVAEAPVAEASDTTPSDDYAHLSDVELRLARENVGIGGPIALLSVGGGVFLLGTPVLLSGLATNAFCLSADCGAGGVIGVGAGMMVVGAAMAIGGGVWLGDRIKTRREMDRALQQRQVSLHLDLMSVAGGSGLAVSGTF